ncbi:MAG: M20/M25/M40 family metallo-hydrolase [Synergistaceae bacterium]|nr:M20/M25/M40 family metallo-hydrolase [Synergistaceae bacterium]
MTDGGLRWELEHNLRRCTEAAAILSEDLAAHPEVSGREYRSSRKIVDVFREGGLEVEHPFPEMAAVFRAAKEGGAAAKVALLVEYDALPDLGHGCGHSLHGAMSVLAGLALAPLMKRLDGALVLFGTPAEECDGAKVPLAADGIFDDVDLALMIHCNGGSSSSPSAP